VKIFPTQIPNELPWDQSQATSVRRKILEYCEFYKRNSICQEAAKILQTRKKHREE
jgi:hypothetical protein